MVYTTPIAGPPVYHYGYGYDDDDDDWDDALVAGGIILGGAVILDEIFDDDDWDGWDGDDDIDWDGGDITIDRGDVNIDIDRDDIDIDRDDLDIGDGDRPRIGDGDRVSIGDSDRTQVDRGDLAGIGERAGDRPRAGTLPANRSSISNAASRDVARQKIETRKTSGAGPATLGTQRPAASRGDGLRVARPGAIPVDDPVGAGDLATEGEPDPDGPGAEPFERLRPAVALAPFGVQQPRAIERGSSRGRRGRGGGGGGRSGGGGLRR